MRATKPEGVALVGHTGASFLEGARLRVGLKEFRNSRHSGWFPFETYPHGLGTIVWTADEPA